MSKIIGVEFEKAIQLLVKHFVFSDKNKRKPVLFHDIRVGVYLYENGYSADIVLAGILHDAIEWFGIDEEIIAKEFSDNISQIVLANTKNDLISDKFKKTEELILRCVKSGQDALIVKTADIIDSFKWYFAQNNEDELKYCMRNAKAILKFKPAEYKDKIFDELISWHDKFLHLSE